MGRKKYALTILYFFAASSQVTSAQAGGELYPAECTNLEDCNNLWRHGEAFACLGGKCACHPNATFDAANKNCICNQGYTRNGNQCFVQPNPPPPPPPSPPAAPPSPPLPHQLANGSVGTNPAVRGAVRNCASDADCLENAQCLPTGCECKSGYALISNACKKVASYVGDPCELDDQCQAELGGYSKCENKKCVCMTHSVAVINNTECMLKKKLDEKCTYHEQCNHIKDVICKGDVCLCDSGFVAHEESCIAVVDNYNAVCIASIQCQNGKLGYGSLCKHIDGNVDIKACTCEQEYFYRRDTRNCVFAKGLEESCDNVNNGCYLPQDGEDQHIECRNKICSCKKGFIPSEDKSQCENAAAIKHVNYIILAVSLLLYVLRWEKTSEM